LTPPSPPPFPTRRSSDLVNRRLDPRPGGRVLNPDERLTVMEAMRVYTYNGAYAHFEEQTKGSIEPGKLADLAVLSKDILAVPTRSEEHTSELQSRFDLVC